MNKFTVVWAIAFFAFSMNVFADPHIDEAIKHATSAVEHGKAGHASILVEHTVPALEHAMTAVIAAKGLSLSHLNNAITDLEEAKKHGKMEHADIATTYAETALEHLKAANK